LEDRIGYIIFVFPLPQDCAVGLLFALLPILSGASGLLQGVGSMAKSYVQYYNPSFAWKYTFHFSIVKFSQDFKLYQLEVCLLHSKSKLTGRFT
jgi:hypothetical protein